MGELPEDEIRSTLHVERKLNDEFLEACKKKYGKKFKKKLAYTDLMREFVSKMNDDTKDTPDTPTESTEIVTSDDMSAQQKETIAKQIAEERKKQELIANPPPNFPKLTNGKSNDEYSFLSHVPSDRKIKITRIEID